MQILGKRGGERESLESGGKDELEKDRRKLFDKYAHDFGVVMISQIYTYAKFV